MIHGFDISGFQGTSVPIAHFIIIKATEGKGYTSSHFDAQWADAGRKGMLRGAYHFARPEESSAVSQADRLLAKAEVVPGEMLCLDLEVSKLSQTQTNAWAKAFGDRLREKAPGVTTVVYLGSGYASNGTGRNLSQHFNFWWYPQYPSTAKTSRWQASFTPRLPAGITTGWTMPHIWQWTNNFNGLDASISPLTLDQLAGHTQPKPWPGTLYRYTAGHALMHGSNVKWIQERLNAHGAHLKVDSEYGAKTRDAVRAFQKAHHLTVDGVVGKQTWGALAR
jgi:glycosyl hydrolase family 25/putative peptidoglycan binding protein